MLRPKQVSEQLGVSATTLRRWSDQYTEHLSPSAGRSVTDNGGSAQRRYTLGDIDVLKRVKQLLDEGKTTEDALQALQDGPGLTETAIVVQAPTLPPAGVPAVVLEGFREALASKDQALAALEETVATQRELIEQLRSQIPKPEPGSNGTKPPSLFRRFLGLFYE